MKKFKVSFIAVFAVLLGIGFSSFTVPHTTTQVWFSLTGTNNTQASSYTLAGGTGSDPMCQQEPTSVCAILATDDGNGNPVQSELNSIRSSSGNFSALDANVEYYKP